MAFRSRYVSFRPAYVKGVIGDPVAAGSAVPAAPPAAAAEARRLAAEVVATAGWTPERAPVLVNSAALDAFLSCRGIQVRRWFQCVQFS